MELRTPFVTRAGSLIPVVGNLWDYHDEGWRVVVTTNIGWHPATLANNMGAGSVAAAARTWPDLQTWYGALCKKHGNALGVVQYRSRRLMFLPVKPLLSVSDPERSWDQEASMPLIDRGLHDLSRIALSEVGPRIALAFPGCGNGGLSRRAVLPLMQRWLSPAARAGVVQVVEFDLSSF